MRELFRLKVIREERPVFALFILDLVTGEQVREAPVEAMRPVKGPLHLPDHPRKGQSHLLFVRRHRGRAEDEVEDLKPGLLDPLGVLGAQQRLG